MSDDGEPLLADMGRSKLIDYRGFTTSFSGSARYLAPEILVYELDMDDFDALESPTRNLTRQTDVYAFSMVMIEVSNILCTQVFSEMWRGRGNECAVRFIRLVAS